MENNVGSHTSDALARLHTLNQVCVRQKTTMLSGNKYVVTDPAGEVLLQAKEQGSLGWLGSKDRPFDIDIMDAQDRVVIALRRPYTFGPDKMEVTVCKKLVSVVRQEITFFKKVLNINDANDQPALRVKGPGVTTGECDFEIFKTNKQRVGVIKKTFGGWKRELLTDSDNFIIEFPKHLHVNLKAAIIGTCFLIDFLYYEN